MHKEESTIEMPMPKDRAARDTHRHPAKCHEQNVNLAAKQRLRHLLTYFF